METARDIVTVIAGITVILTLPVLVVVAIRLYGRAGRALDRVGRAADDVHVTVQGARSGARAIGEALGTAGPALRIVRAVRLVVRWRRTAANQERQIEESGGNG